MRPTNEIRRYNVTSSLIGWEHSQNDPSDQLLDVMVSHYFLDFNTLMPRQNGRHFPDDIFKCIFLEFIHVSSLCFSSSILSADAYMITSTANILRTHLSWVKLEISLMNSKNKTGHSTEPFGMPFFISRYSDVSYWNETSCWRLWK